MATGVGSGSGSGSGPAPPPCQGLYEEYCKPCPPPESQTVAICKWAKTQCSESFCNPLCLKWTWSASIEVSAEGPLGEQLGKPIYMKALQTEFMAAQCADTLQCCNRDSRLDDYVENAVYWNEFPVPQLPVPACVHDPKDDPGKLKDLCNKCKR